MPLTSERFTDLAELFNEGGDPKWCWCMYFRTPGLDWSNSTTEGNREGLRALAGRDLAPGLVGYRDGRAVGWVSLAPREDYGRLERSKLLARIDDTPVWSIVCFVVSRKSRGQGVADALLHGAIAYAWEHGATMIEAYPVAATRGQVSSSSRVPGRPVDVPARRLHSRRDAPVEQVITGAADHAPRAHLNCRPGVTGAGAVTPVDARSASNEPTSLGRLVAFA